MMGTERTAEQKAKRAAYMRQWNARNPEKLAEQKPNIAARMRQYRARNPQRVTELRRQWRLQNREKLAKRQREYRAANAEKLAEGDRNYRKTHPGWAAAQAAKYRASTLRATPRWADHDAINDIYLEAAYQQMVVDHEIPLQSNRVCGLHWEGNLQLLTFEQNAKKCNRFAL